MKTTHDLSVIDVLLKSSLHPPQPVSAFKDWKQEWTELSAKFRIPADRAIIGGLAADRPAWAFAAGYQAAIHSLFEPDDPSQIAAICITEKGRPHPSAIETRLTSAADNSGERRLDGFKNFISGGGEADILWVAASVGRSPEGRNSLRMVRVPILSSGITIDPMPPLGFIPEMPHARVKFASVPLTEEAVLPGDAYLQAVKPFRTLEDLHVTAAFLAFLFGTGRRNRWPENILESILALIVCARTLALDNPLASHIHIALGGFFGQFHHLLEGVEPLMQEIETASAKTWRRDRKLLEIAETARKRRLRVAWESYGRKCRNSQSN